MSDEQISVEAAEKKSTLEMHKFLIRWGQHSQVEYGIDDFRQAVINDYAYACYQDGGTQPDEIPLKQYKKDVEAMSCEELIAEASIDLQLDEMVDYIEMWLRESVYAELTYELTDEGGTTLTRLKGQELVDKVNQLGEIRISDTLRACGYVSAKDDGQETLHFTDFFEALCEAKGVSI